MISRTIFDEEHHIFRETVRRFIQAEISPHHGEWEKQGFVSREAWEKAGAAGLLCMTMPAEYGGAGADRLFSAILLEELALAGASGPNFVFHSELVAPYILNYASDLLKQRWLPKMATGEIIAGIAMTEPGGGSDLKNVKMKIERDGDGYAISGSKIFISSGYNANILVVVCRNGETMNVSGLSLVVVETDSPGFRRGRLLDKVGMKANDTAELFFDGVKVPAENIVGVEGEGFGYLKRELAWERMLIAIYSMATCEAALQWTLDYVKSRRAFGQSVWAFQNSRFTLADIAAEVQIGRFAVDQCMSRAAQHRLDGTTAAMIKLWVTDLQGRVMDRCVQLHGGYGYMLEYPIARAYTDARVQRIVGGTNEIMKEIIARSL